MGGLERSCPEKWDTYTRTKSPLQPSCFHCPYSLGLQRCISKDTPGETVTSTPMYNTGMAHEFWDLGTNAHLIPFRVAPMKCYPTCCRHRSPGPGLSPRPGCIQLQGPADVKREMSCWPPPEPGWWAKSGRFSQVSTPASPMTSGPGGPISASRLVENKCFLPPNPPFCSTFPPTEL